MPRERKPPPLPKPPELDPSEPVDLDLDVLRPKGGTFRHGGRVYFLPAEVGVPLIVDFLGLQQAMKDKREEGLDALAAYLSEFYDRVMEQIRLVNDEVPNLLLGNSELQRIVGLMMRGGGRPAEADTHLEGEAVQTLKGGGATTDTDEDGEAEVTELPPTRATPGGARRAAGRSGGRSRAKS